MSAALRLSPLLSDACCRESAAGEAVATTAAVLLLLPPVSVSWTAATAMTPPTRPLIAAISPIFCKRIARLLLTPCCPYDLPIHHLQDRIRPRSDVNVVGGDYHRPLITS